MITLYYSSLQHNICLWQERLENLAIKHQLIQQEQLSEPFIQYGDDYIQGSLAIEAYLDKLEELVKSWYDDRCDKYEFE